jgi:hypothetical protein
MHLVDHVTLGPLSRSEMPGNLLPPFPPHLPCLSPLLQADTIASLKMASCNLRAGCYYPLHEG